MVDYLFTSSLRSYLPFSEIRARTSYSCLSLLLLFFTTSSYSHHPPLPWGQSKILTIKEVILSIFLQMKKVMIPNTIWWSSSSSFFALFLLAFLLKSWITQDPQGRSYLVGNAMPGLLIDLQSNMVWRDPIFSLIG